MFADTIKRNLEDIKGYRMRSREEKDSYSYEEIVVEDEICENPSTDDEIFDELYEITPEEVDEYIVENPDEVKVEFPIKSDVEPDFPLPFFKSISFKLGNGKLVNITP